MQYFWMRDSRRLPVYLLIDVSESMVGEPLQAVEMGIRRLLTELRDNPEAVETARLTIIEFASRAKEIVHFEELHRIRLSPLSVAQGTRLGTAFELLAYCIERDVRRRSETQRGDWRPIIFLLTDGRPTDDWTIGRQRLQAAIGAHGANIVAVGCGDDVDLSVLKQVTPNVLHISSTRAEVFASLLAWVSASIGAASRSVGAGGGSSQLPPPPPGFRIVETPPPSPPPTSQTILALRCRQTGGGYLMRYRRPPGAPTFRAEGAYRVGEDYFAEAELRAQGRLIESSVLEGAAACPYCGRNGFRLRPDGLALECHDRVEIGRHPTQVMFVLDVTGSMGGEISGVKAGIRRFVDEIETAGLTVEVGLTAFRDLQAGEPAEVLQFRGRPFTTDVEAFKESVTRLRPRGGGGDRFESSFDGLLQASRQPFSPDAQHIFVLITDQLPWLPDGEIRSEADIVLALRRVPADQVYVVAPARVAAGFNFLTERFNGALLELGANGRGSDALVSVLEQIGKSVQLLARDS